MQGLSAQVYKHIGRVIGRFYTADGDRTAELERVEAAAGAAARLQPEASPGSPCNVQWSATSGERRLLCPHQHVFSQTSVLPVDVITGRQPTQENPLMPSPSNYVSLSIKPKHAGFISMIASVMQSACSGTRTSSQPLDLPSYVAPHCKYLQSRITENWFCAGKEVWCTPGKGFPRRISAAPGADGAVVNRCECLEQPIYSDAAQLYDGCAPSAVRCSVPEEAR